MKKLLKISSIFAIVAGIVLVAGGIWGICFTYQNVAREKIITPADASIPEKPVSGPFTLKAQADIIRVHALKSTGRLTFDEMPRQLATTGRLKWPAPEKPVTKRTISCYNNAPPRN